jgi:hypothetical protein
VPKGKIVGYESNFSEFMLELVHFVLAHLL